MKPVLVINSGSSSLKFQVVDVDSSASLLSGNIERVSNHTEAFGEMLVILQQSGIEPVAVGHRVVHGGSKFAQPTMITPEVIAEIEALVPLAPLHNPGNLAGIRAALEAFVDLPQVAVFDTAFHQSMPVSSYRFAIDRATADAHQIRRFGFHGSSYSYVTRKAAAFLGKAESELNAVILHLGNGASACAVKGGKSFDTSMGLTPLQGLVMGTRSGDLDPAAIFYLNRVAGLSVENIDELLNKRSGLLGLAGVSDMRDVEVAAIREERDAVEALEIYVQRIKHYVGAYTAELGRIDVLVFTAGVGENSVHIRSLVCDNLGALGIEIDPELNALRNLEVRDIAMPHSRVRVLVVPTNEELEIALQSSLEISKHHGSNTI